jgi:hypothetical protein
MKFKLKIVPSWFSSDYVVFKYKKGIFWHTIHCCSETGYGIYDMCKWDYLTYRIGEGNFDYEKEKFSTYDKIKEFEAEEWKELIDNNKKLKEEQKEYEEKKKKSYERANR